MTDPDDMTQGHKPFETLVEDVRLAREALRLQEGDDLPWVPRAQS